MACQGISMGMGRLASADVVFKRKFRWTFEVMWQNRAVPAAIVKVAARPSLTIEETEINYLNAKMWIPGKASWETITVTYYDVGVKAGGIGGDLTNNLFSWLASVYDFTDPVGQCMSSRRDCYGGRATLKMYDGCGNTMETWVLGHVWPTAVNFGDLDYSSSEEATIELTLRYAEAQYTPGCSAAPLTPICCGCY